MDYPRYKYRRAVFLRKNINDLNNILGLTDMAPGILARLERGEKFPADARNLANRVGIDLNKDGTPTANTRVELEGFIASRGENLEQKNREETELERLIAETRNHIPWQDSSDITGDTEPMDFMDPDG